MPLVTIIVPQIPAESQDKFLAAWPTLKGDLSGQPGVAGAFGGPIVAENGSAVTEFRFIQCILFKTAEDAAAFAGSAWAQEHKARYESRAGGEPVAARFEVADFPSDPAELSKAFMQFSTLELPDEAKGSEAGQAWSEMVSVLGKSTWGGRSIGDGPSVGLGVIGWNSLEEAAAAFKDPKVADVFAKYQSCGKGKNVMVKRL